MILRLTYIILILILSVHELDIGVGGWVQISEINEVIESVIMQLDLMCSFQMSHCATAVFTNTILTSRTTKTAGDSNQK